MQKKLIFLMLLPLLLFGLCTQVCAAENAKPDKSCSITFLMEFDGKALEGGSLTIFRVGQISADGDSFEPLDIFSDDGLNFDNLDDPQLAKSLNELAVEYKLSSDTAPIVGGQAVFGHLQTGIYVVSQSDGQNIPGYEAISPFLVSLPQWQNDIYVYDLVASPKVSVKPLDEPTQSFTTEPNTPDTTTPADKPWLPQTGQLNWPVPVMIVSGLSLFVIGAWLFFGAKRRRV